MESFLFFKTTPIGAVLPKTTPIFVVLTKTAQIGLCRVG
jgi:hypothetical protein